MQEYLSRPTARASFWPEPFQHVLGGRDLLRSAQGTWLGVTLDGRLAVLTNFRDEDPTAAQGKLSRGEMVNAFLKPPAKDVPDVEAFVHQLVTGEGARGAGGFSLVCGRVGEELAVVSNRTNDTDAVKWIARAGETVGLSNAAFGDRTWPKVVNGENALKSLVEEAVSHGTGKEELIDRLFSLLSVDTLPPALDDEAPELRGRKLKNSIFISVFGGGKQSQGQETNSVGEDNLHRVASVEPAMTGAYGTQKQTVVLVDRTGNVTYVEKSLFDDEGRYEQSGGQISRFDFTIKN